MQNSTQYGLQTATNTVVNEEKLLPQSMIQV